MLRSSLALALLCVCLIVPAIAQQPPTPSVPTAPAESVQRIAPDYVYFPTDPPPVPKRTTLAPPPAAVVADILRIRAAQGDSTPESDAEFRDALRQVANEEAAKRAAARTDHGALPAPPTINPYFAPAVGSVAPAIGAAPLVASLRQAARHLDSVAADYEERNDYELAEKTRTIATSLRTQARQLQSPSEPQVKTY